MKRDPGFIFRIVLMFGDALAIFAGFIIAYLVRIHLDSRPFYFEASTIDFAMSVFVLIPFWWVILALLGLYRRQIYLRDSKTSETYRLAAAAVLGIMTLISYDFFFKRGLFPTRAVALLATIFCFILLKITRSILRRLRLFLLIRQKMGAQRAIILGNSESTTRLIEYFAEHPEEGYRVVSVVAGKKYIPKSYRSKQSSSLKDAFKSLRIPADVIFHTDNYQTDYAYSESIKHHVLYYHIPSEDMLAAHTGSLTLIGDTPAILVKVTPLNTGAARFVKRTGDLILTSFLLILAFLPMTLIWLLIKLSAPKLPALFKDIRLSRYNKKVTIFKFRSMKPEFSGLTPEEAFKKLGHPELIKKYRENGDYLDDDPRVTKLGKFLRKTSLDELPQLWNVLRGSISLVGPRALVPGELRDYGDRSLLLSVKSGLTGLAQVSGRRDLSFAERRTLDLYYIQNWSVRLDFEIIIRTVVVVLTHKGAK